MRPNTVSAEINELVADVLSGMPRPYPSNIIDNVFVRIEGDTLLHTRYRGIETRTSHARVNRGTGMAVLIQTGLTTIDRSYTPQSTLIGSFSVLG